MSKIIIKVGTLNKTLDYLSKQPYIEVFTLISNLQAGKPFAGKITESLPILQTVDVDKDKKKDE